MTELPNPKALRSVTWSFGTDSRCCAANIRAAARSAPSRSAFVPASTPGLSARNTHRQMEGVGDVEEVRGLLRGCGVDGAGPYARVVGDDRDAAATEAGERRDE